MKHPSEHPAPNLGCATTHELITELMVRFEMTQFIDDVTMKDRGTLAVMARNLQATLNVLGEDILSYRTVD